MATVARELGARGIRVVRFEFPYMAKRREDGKRRPPDRQPVLLDCWRQVIVDLGNPRHVVIGGKSMGGRMASLIADEAGVAGLVAFGFPFHAPGKPPGTRIDHLASLQAPSLFLQGTRDPLGNRDEVEGYALSSSIALHWIEDGDHNLKPRVKVTGRSHDDVLAEAIDRAAAFITQVAG